MFQLLGSKAVYSLRSPATSFTPRFDVRHGAISIVPTDSLPSIAVSSRISCLSCALRGRPSTLCQTSVQDGRLSTANQRPTLAEQAAESVYILRDLEKIKVPFPAQYLQRSIVDFWHEAERAVAVAQQNLAKPVTALNNRLLEIYRKESPKDVIHTRFFALDFKDLDAWDAKSGRAAAFRLACPSFRPMGDFIEEATELVRPFDMPEKAWPVYGVNNKEGVFLNSYQKGETFNAAYKRIRKDWFFHNPTRCNVGSLGIVPDVPEDAITSPEYQVWRVKEDARGPMLPGFVAVLIQTPFFIDLVQFNRVGAVKQRMYTENLYQLRIPYLPVSEQQAYAQAREKALTDLDAAKARLTQARQDVEAMILGSKNVERVGNGRETLTGDQK